MHVFQRFKDKHGRFALGSDSMHGQMGYPRTTFFKIYWHNRANLIPQMKENYYWTPAQVPNPVVV